MESMVGASAGGDGNCFGGGVHRNRCLCLKAAFSGSVKFLAHTAFAARVAITAAVVWRWSEWWE